MCWLLSEEWGAMELVCMELLKFMVMVSRSQHAVMCKESITRQARAVPSSKML